MYFKLSFLFQYRFTLLLLSSFVYCFFLRKEYNMLLNTIKIVINRLFYLHIKVCGVMANESPTAQKPTHKQTAKLAYTKKGRKICRCGYKSRRKNVHVFWMAFELKNTFIKNLWNGYTQTHSIMVILVKRFIFYCVASDR